MKAVDGKRAPCRVEVTDSDPVFCDLSVFVPVFDFQPFAFVNGSENIVIYIVHRFPDSAASPV